MLVKHNIWYQANNHFDLVFLNFEDATEYTKNQENIVGHLKDEYESGLLLFEYNLKDCVDEGVTITMDIENSGEVPIYFQQQGFAELRRNIKTIKPREKTTVKIQGVYRNISFSRQLRFEIRDKGTFSFSFKNISAYKGYDVDVQLPYVGNLPVDKQALLPPEGNFKEIKSI